MDTDKLHELIEVINDSLVAFRHISLQLRTRKAMLPSLLAQIEENVEKSERAMQALGELRDELGIYSVWLLDMGMDTLRNEQASSS